MSNRVRLSEDRMEMVISSESGNTATLRSARPGGFTEADVDRARDFPLNPRLIPGQLNRARRFHMGRRTFYVHVNTGPPTWWLPKVKIRHSGVMVGWLRGLVALSWGGAAAVGDGEPRDEFGNAEREIRMVAVAARARGDYKAERLALDRLALMERAAVGDGEPQEETDE